MTSRDRRLCGPARALLVIDQPELAAIVRLGLNHDNYTARIAPTAEDASRALAGWKPHLVVLDMDTAGSAVLEQLSSPVRRGDCPPVFAITRRDDVKVRLAAFEQGADDILTIPFSREEFVARILALMRRTYRDALVFAPVLRLAGLEIDILNHRVRAGDTDLHLTSLEQSLLYLLAANAGRLLSRDEILDYLWGADYVAGSNVVDRHIRNLRVKLQNHPHRPQYIATVPGRGYRFVPTLACANSVD